MRDTRNDQPDLTQSCCFCIFAPEAALLLAGSHNRELLAEYVRHQNLDMEKEN